MQFFDQRIWLVWAGTLGAYALSALTAGTWWMAVWLVVAFACQATLTYKSLLGGLLLVVYETFVGGHGHLFTLSAEGWPLSLRMVLFIGLFCGYGWALVRGQVDRPRLTRAVAPWLAWAGAVCLAVLIGLVSFGPAQVFDDANGYASLALIIPGLSLRWTRTERRNLILTLVAAVGWLFIFSLSLLFTFSHLPGKVLDDVYRFVRDTRLYEVTLISGDRLSTLLPSGAWYFRVFAYGQVLAGMMVFLAGWAWVAGQRSRALWFVMIASLSGLFGSLSRSAFFGVVVAATLALWPLVIMRPGWRPVWQAVWRSVAAGAVAIALLWLSVAIPPRPDISNWPFYKGNGGNSRGAAVSSRWNLLPPLNEKITTHPWLGSGLGDTVTYISDDPRIRDINPTGEYTTMRVEWGYHDIWWKLGLAGTLSVLWLSFQFAARTMRTTGDDRWLTYGAFGMVAVILGTNVFSPYLNHPIGLTGLLAASWLMTWPERTEKKSQQEKISLPTPVTGYRAQAIASRVR